MNVICCQTGAEEGQGHLRDWLAETLNVSFLFPTLLWWCISCLLCGQESSGTRQKWQGSARATPEPKWEASSHNTCVPPERSLIEPSPSILWARQWYERLSVLIKNMPGDEMFPRLGWWWWSENDWIQVANFEIFFLEDHLPLTHLENKQSLSFYISLRY